LVNTVKADKEKLTEILKRINIEQAPLNLLRKLVDLPNDILREVQEVMLNLLKSANNDIRSITVASLSKGWIDKEEADKFAKEMLLDKDPIVRNQAVLVLRQIMYQQMKEDSDYFSKISKEIE
jgi:HEAT repeat protein